MAKLISKTYGEALYEVASEKGNTAEMLQEIRELRTVLKENPDYGNLMIHPAVPKPEKVEVTEKIFRGRVSDELLGFLVIVVEKERFKELEAAFTYFEDRVKEEQGVGVVYVTTPKELDATAKDAVRKKILETTDYHTLEMHYALDESLIGGIVIRIGDRVADGSVRNKIDHLTKELLDIQLETV